MDNKLITIYREKISNKLNSGSEYGLRESWAYLTGYAAKEGLIDINEILPRSFCSLDIVYYFINFIRQF